MSISSFDFSWLRSKAPLVSLTVLSKDIPKPKIVFRQFILLTTIGSEKWVTRNHCCTSYQTSLVDIFASYSQAGPRTGSKSIFLRSVREMPCLF